MVLVVSYTTLIFLKYHRVARMISIELLVWILDVLFKSTLNMLVYGVRGFGFDPYFS